MNKPYQFIDLVDEATGRIYPDVETAARRTGVPARLVEASIDGAPLPGHEFKRVRRVSYETSNRELYTLDKKAGAKKGAATRLARR